MNAITNENGYPSFDPNYVPFFESNQVLKDSDLNSIVTYLDSHNRLTRNHLIGMGIVCGLEVQLSDDRSAIRISPGCGITSDGSFIEYALSTGENADDVNRFTHYRDDESIAQDRLIPNASLSKNFQLQELISAAEAKQPNDKHKLLSGFNLSEKVVMIFCQWDDEERNSCLVDCNNRGKNRNFKLRFFLIDKANSNPEILSAEKLLQSGFGIKTGTSLTSAFQGWFEVPDCQIDRLDRLTNIERFDDLIQAYNRVCQAGISSIHKALTETHKLFSPFISTFQPGSSELKEIGVQLNRVLNELIAATNGTASPQVSYGIQYFYDYLVELIAAFNELKTVLFDLMDECPPNMQWFPKYLLAGAVVPSIEPCDKPDIYRHAFYQPPIYNGNRQRKQEVRHLYERLVQMSTKFQLLPFYQTPIKITPSRTRQARLGEQAIPYFYSYPDLYPYWNYDACRKQRADRIPAYFLKNGLSNQHGYDLIPRIDWADFFRVEGHLGLPLNQAIDRIKQDRHDFNLAFDLVAVKLGTGKEDPDLLQGYFDDLEVEFDLIKSNWQQKYDRAKASIKDRNILSILDRFNEHFFRQPDLQKIDRGLMQNDFLETAKNSDNYEFRLIEGEENNFKIVLNIQIKRPFRTAILTDQGDNSQIDRTKKLTLADAGYREQNQVHIREIFANDFSSDFSILQLEIDSNGILRFVINVGIESIELVGTDSDLLNLPIRLEDETPYSFDTLIDRYHDFDALFTFLKYFGGSQGLTPEAAAKLVSYYEFRALFNRYLLRLESVKQMQLFKEYAKHHPGLEHLGGVPNGGTLVLVYTSDPAVIERTIAADLNLLKNSNLEVRNIEKKAQFPPDRLSGKDRSQAIDRIGQNVVVADFCLPYFCCSPYSNLDYVVAKPKPFIGLPQPVYCEGDTKIYDFVLEPPGGLLKGGDGIIDHNGNYAFQPSTVDADVTEPMNLTFFYIVDGVGSSYSILLLPHVEIQFSIDPSDNSICVSPDKPKLIKLIATPAGGQFQLSIGDNNPYQNISVNKNNQFDLSSLFSANDKKAIDLHFIYKVPNTDDYCGGTSETLSLTAIRQPLAQIKYRKNGKGQAIGTLGYNENNCSDLKLRVKFQNSGNIADNYEWLLNGESVSRNRDVEIEIPYTADSNNVTLIAHNGNIDSDPCPGRDDAKVTLPPLDPNWKFDNPDLPTKPNENGESAIVLCRLGSSEVIPQQITVEQSGGKFISQPEGLIVKLANRELQCQQQTQYLLDFANTSAGTYNLIYTLPDGSQSSRPVEVVVVPVGSFKLNVENQNQSESEFQVSFTSIQPRRRQQLRYTWEITIGGNLPVITEELTNTFQYAGPPSISPGNSISVVMRISDPNSLCVTTSESRTDLVPGPPTPIG